VEIFGEIQYWGSGREKVCNIDIVVLRYLLALKDLEEIVMFEEPKEPKSKTKNIRVRDSNTSSRD